MESVICPNCGRKNKIRNSIPSKFKCSRCKAVFGIEYEDENGNVYPGGLKGFIKRHHKFFKVLGYILVIGIIAAVLGAIAAFLHPKSENSDISPERTADDRHSMPILPTAPKIKSSPNVKCKTEKMGPIPKTEEENMLLEKMRSGMLDGPVGEPLLDNGYGSSIQLEIKNGTPQRTKCGPGGKVFDGKENESWNSTPKIDTKWRTDDSKLFFLQKYGFLSDDPDVKAYSAKYKGKV